MIQLEVNGNRDTVEPATSAELRQAIQRTCPPEHVICQLKVNGYEIAESRLDDYDLQAIRSVEVQSGAPRDLARESIGSTMEWIASICGVLDSVANDYRMGHERKAAERLVPAIDALQVLVELLGGIHSFLDVEDSRRDLLGTTWTDAEAELRDAVDGLLEDLQAQDPIRLADRAGYLLPRSLTRFRDILEQVSA